MENMAENKIKSLFLNSEPFNQSDWYGFAGCQQWETENTSYYENKPLTVTGSNDNWFMVVDRNYMSIWVYENGEERGVFAGESPFKTQKDAIEAFSVISADVKPEVLVNIFSLD